MTTITLVNRTRHRIASQDIDPRVVTAVCGQRIAVIGKPWGRRWATWCRECYR